MMIFGRRDRQQQDAMRGVHEVWNRLAEAFNNKTDDFAYYFANVAYDSEEDDCSSPGYAVPRIDITDLNPQHSDIYTKEWSGKELQKKWTDIRKLCSPYFSKWNSSGHNKDVQDASDEDDDDNHTSITDFLPHPEGDRFQSYTAAASSKGKGRPKGKIMHKEKVIKYMHLLFKGDDDLMQMAMKAYNSLDSREGGLSAGSDDE